MVQKHIVLIKGEDGSCVSYPMKPWLRKNREDIPVDMDPDENNSHTLRRGLRNKGWNMVEKPDQIILIKPSVDGDVSYADEFLEGYPEEEENVEQEIEAAEELTFGLERDMQAALRSNIEQIEPGLKIIDGGKERSTEAGRIDITAVDKNDNIVVIELKAGQANPPVIAQILAYMGSMSETEKKPVRGVLVAGDFHERVILATRAVPNLCLKRYSFQFSFSDVG